MIRAGIASRPCLLGLCTILAAFSIARGEAPDALFSHPTSVQGLAEDLLAEPAQALATARSLRGRFTHRKFLAELPAPLVAEGEFLFARDLGIYWHTQRPFESEFILTRAGMLERDEGSETLRLKSAEQPAVRAAAEIFLAIFALDLATLGRSFDTYGRKDGKSWELGLRPKSAALKSVLTEVVVRGARQVETIELEGGCSDLTDLAEIPP